MTPTVRRAEEKEVLLTPPVAARLAEGPPDLSLRAWHFVMVTGYVDFLLRRIPIRDLEKPVYCVEKS
jgi:hypothetical protein